MFEPVKKVTNLFYKIVYLCWLSWF